jgi:Spy/CpxP family protein refolding chaperone
MRRAALAIGVVLLATTMISAQEERRRGGGGGMGRGGPFGLLRQASVQQELQLSDEQIQQIKEESDKMRSKFQGMSDMDQQERRKKMQELNAQSQKTIEKILKPEQQKRLQEIMIQQQGLRALANAKVADQLGLEDNQKSQIREITEAAGREMRQLMGGGGSPEDSRDKMEEMRKKTDSKIEEVLTAAQKAKWKEMQGKPFKGELTPPGGRERRRDGGGNG